MSKKQRINQRKFKSKDGVIWPPKKKIDSQCLTPKLNLSKMRGLQIKNHLVIEGRKEQAIYKGKIQDQLRLLLSNIQHQYLIEKRLKILQERQVTQRLNFQPNKSQM